MSRPFHPAVVTANDLRSGRVVWLAADGKWVDTLAHAELIEDEAIADLRLLAATGQSDRVVGPYLAAARAGPSGPEPTHFRERFRRDGPSYDKTGA